MVIDFFGSSRSQCSRRYLVLILLGRRGLNSSNPTFPVLPGIFSLVVVVFFGDKKVCQERRHSIYSSDYSSIQSISQCMRSRILEAGCTHEKKCTVTILAARRVTCNIIAPSPSCTPYCCWTYFHSSDSFLSFVYTANVELILWVPCLGFTIDKVCAIHHDLFPLAYYWLVIMLHTALTASFRCSRAPSSSSRAISRSTSSLFALLFFNCASLCIFRSCRGSLRCMG